MRFIGELYSYISNILTRYDLVSEAASRYEKTIKEIDETISDPTKLFESELLKTYLLEEKERNISEIEYLRIISLAEDYNPNLLKIKQINETYEQMKSLLNERKKFFEEKIDKYKETIDKDKIHISILQEFNNFLSHYSPFYYVDESDIEIINRAFEIISQDDYTDEKILGWFEKLYFEIARNNSSLERNIRETIIERRTREREQENLEKLQRNKEQLRQESESKKEKEKIVEFLKSLKETNYFEIIERIKDNISELSYKRLKVIGEEYKKCIENITNQALSDIVIYFDNLYEPETSMGDMLNDYVEILLNNNYLPIAIVKKVNELIKNENYNELESSLEDVKSFVSGLLSNEQSVIYCNTPEYLNALNEADKIVDLELVNKEKDKIDSFNSASNYLSDQEKTDLFESSNIDIDALYQYNILKMKVSLICSIFDTNYDDPEEVELLSETHDDLNKVIKEYKDYRKKIGVPLDEENTSLEGRMGKFKKNPYDSTFENYVIFLDPVDLKLVEKKYVEIEKSEIARKIEFLISSGLATILKGGGKKNTGTAISKPIMIDSNKENPYSIRALKAGGKESRLGFKVLDSKFNEKNIILVITASRGKVDKKAKHEELQRNITIYKDQQDYVQKVEEMFEKYANIDFTKVEEDKEKQKENQTVIDFVEDIIIDGLDNFNYFVGDDDPQIINSNDKKRGGMD